MASLLIQWIITSIAIWVAAYVLPGVTLDSPTTAIVTALILGIVNTFIRPLILILTLPITIITLGLFALVINAALILLVSSVVPGFTVAGFTTAILFGVVLAIVSFFLNLLTPSSG